MIRPCAVAIFAKTIGLSSVKTRLAKSIGKTKAEAFYQYAQKTVLSTVKSTQSQFPTITPYIAIAEFQALDHPFWQKYKKNFNLIWTKEGSLGARIHHVYSTLQNQHGQVIVIGTDSPQLQNETLIAAYKKLCKHNRKIVIGPSIDGGFYLFAANFVIDEKEFTQVTYSQEDTLKQLVTKLTNKNIDYLQKELDVDTVEDLKDLIKLKTFKPKLLNKFL